ncbi:hypothetical protein M8J76_016665 [Diaphorina citri]|nr:hypothetical protein M8J76_016665 [Diaphorina citri]
MESITLCRVLIVLVTIFSKNPGLDNKVGVSATTISPSITQDDFQDLTSELDHQTGLDNQIGTNCEEHQKIDLPGLDPPLEIDLAGLNPSFFETILHFESVSAMGLAGLFH